MSKFVHLHVHSTYSPLDGMIRIPQLVEKVKKLKQPAVAITDHGLLSGAPQLYWECKKQDIIPLIGEEFYITPNNSIKESRSDNHHIVLIARNEEGYRLLVELSSVANLPENFYYSPRIDWNILKHYRKKLSNVIALTGCMSGEIQESFDSDRETSEIVQFYQRMFSNLYVELQVHPLASQKPSDKQFVRKQRRNNKLLVEIARNNNIPIVVTNDAHYLDKEDAFAHDVMLAIQTKSPLDKEDRFRFNGNDYYITSQREMRERFPQDIFKESLRNMADICSTVNVVIPEFEKRVFHIPKFGANSLDLIKDVCLHELKKRKLGKEYKERYEYEIEILSQTNFADEIMVVKDYVDWARKEGIQSGNRGSMVGVLVSFLLGITDVDPVKYGLSFERAINPERPSLPDFDVDFEEDRRLDVIEYLRQRWGEEHVSLVGTFNTLQPRGIIGSIMKSLGYSFQEQKEVTSLLPDRIEISNLKRKATIHDILESEGIPEELQKVIDRYPWITEVAIKLQGIVNSLGTHAAGVVISDKDQPVRSYIPTMRLSSNNRVSQYDMYALGSMGFIKFDVLGLTTLSVISQCKKFIGFDPTAGVDIFSDKDTLEMLNQGDVHTIFELQGGASRQAVKVMGVKDFDDVIALQALSRAGANQFIPDYKEGRDGSNKWRSRLRNIHPNLLDCLSRTYGAVVYQEQVMDITRLVAGLSWSWVDKTKDAIKHKSSKEFEELRGPFWDGCRSQNMSEDKIQTVWSMIDRYCGYGFNQSHATAYAIVSMTTAYLKCHFPREWFASVLNYSLFGRYQAIVENARLRGVKFYPVDINRSQDKCVPYKDGVLWGLSLIKGVGPASSKAIIDNRKYKSLEQLRTKLSGRQLNSRCDKVLDEVGAYSRIGGNSDVSSASELSLCGAYIRNHPLDPYKSYLDIIYGDKKNIRLLNGDKDAKVIVGGLVTRVNPTTTKRGQDMAFISITYYGQQYDLVAFPRQWEQHRYKRGSVMLFRGTRQADRNSIIIDEVGVLRLRKGEVVLVE